MDPRSRSILKEAVERSAWDPAYFCRFFLPKWFPSEMPEFHLGLLAIMTGKVAFLDEYPHAHQFLLTYFRYEPPADQPQSALHPVFFLDEDGRMNMHREENNAVIVPRGFSKTTLENAANLYVALTENNAVIVYVSETMTHAEIQVGNIRKQLESNQTLRAAYGDQVPLRSDANKWNDGLLMLNSGAVITARGRGGQIRGMNFDSERPTHIVIDDVEDEESIKTKEQREKTQNWLYSSVVPAGNIMEGDLDTRPTQITMLGTLLGADTLLTTVTKDPSFGVVKFGATLPDGNMLWEYKMSREGYEKKRAAYRAVGKLSVFVREYDSIIRNEEDALFPSTFRYHLISRPELVQVSIAMDLAISANPKADHTALVVSGRRASDGGIVFLDEWGGVGKTPREQVDAFFTYHQRWACTWAGVESVAYQAAMVHLLIEEMARRGYFFEVTPILQGKEEKKDQRIVGMLSPRYKNGYITHHQPLPKLEGMLTDWPNGKKDFPDAAAMSLIGLGETALMAGDLEALAGASYPPIETVLQRPAPSGNSRFIIKQSARQLEFNSRYPRS